MASFSRIELVCTDRPCGATRSQVAITIPGGNRGNVGWANPLVDGGSAARLEMEVADRINKNDP